MGESWLSIIGLGEDGPEGLSSTSRAALAGADLVFGAPRHLALACVGDRGHAWPVPFDLAPLLACRGRKVVMLVSGDPFWFGAGGSVASHLAPSDWQAFPVAGTFSLVAARLGWRLEDTLCLGLHAAPFQRLLPSDSRAEADLPDARRSRRGRHGGLVDRRRVRPLPLGCAQFDISYNDTAFNNENGFGDGSTKKFSFDKFINHFVLASTIYLGDKVEVIAGYNFLRRKELNIGNGGNGLNGFSLGAGVMLGKLQIRYARAYYQSNAAYNQLGLNM